MAVFLMVFATIFIAEMGDKTQLLLIAMAGKYKIRDIIIGTSLSIAALNLMAVVIGSALSNYLDMRIIKSIAAVAFYYFSYSMLLGDDDEEDEGANDKRLKSAILSVFMTFAIGELGDKTQLSAITMAASYTTRGDLLSSFTVFLGCTLGLLAADVIGLVVGLFFKGSMPTGLLNKLSILIFAVFGVLNAKEAAMNIFAEGNPKRDVLWIASAAIFVLLCAITIVVKRRKVSR